MTLLPSTLITTNPFTVIRAEERRTRRNSTRSSSPFGNVAGLLRKLLQREELRVQGVKNGIKITQLKPDFGNKKKKGTMSLK